MNRTELKEPQDTVLRTVTEAPGARGGGAAQGGVVGPGIPPWGTNHGAFTKSQKTLSGQRQLPQTSAFSHVYTSQTLVPAIACLLPRLWADAIKAQNTEGPALEPWF